MKRKPPRQPIEVQSIFRHAAVLPPQGARLWMKLEEVELAGSKVQKQASGKMEGGACKLEAVSGCSGAGAACELEAAEPLLGALETGSPSPDDSLTSRGCSDGSVDSVCRPASAIARRHFGDG